MKRDFVTLIARARTVPDHLRTFISDIRNGLREIRPFKRPLEGLTVKITEIIAERIAATESEWVINPEETYGSLLNDLYDRIRKLAAKYLGRLSIDPERVAMEIFRRLKSVSPLQDINGTTESIKEVLRNFPADLLYGMYIGIFEDAIKKRSETVAVSKDQELINVYLNKLCDIIRKEEESLKINFDPSSEMMKYTRFETVLSSYSDLLVLRGNDRPDKLIDVIDFLSERLFPTGRDVVDIFGKLLEKKDMWELQRRMISEEGTTDDRNLGKVFTVVSHNMSEFIERLTEILNTDPRYIEFPINDAEGNPVIARVPAVHRNRLLEPFIGTIAMQFKRYTDKFMEMLGFIPVMDPEADKEKEDDTEVPPEEEDLSDEDFMSVPETGSGKRKKGRKRKKSSSAKKSTAPKDDRPLFVMGQQLLDLLRKYGLVMEIDTGESVKIIPTLNSGTFYRILLANMSLKRKTGISRMLANKIAGFFAIIIYYSTIIKTNMDILEEEPPWNILNKLYERIPPLKLLNDMELKIYLITRLKKLISYPQLLNLDYNKVDDTAIYGRDIFQYLGSENEMFLETLFRLIREMPL